MPQPGTMRNEPGRSGAETYLRGWCPQGRGGSSPPSDTIQWVPTQQSVSQVKFEGAGSPAPLEHRSVAVAKPAPRAALSLLRELDDHRPVPQWRDWVVG